MKYLLFFILFHFSISYNYNLYAQWVPTNCPGSNINCLAVRGSNIIASANEGMYISTDNGLTWSTTPTGPTYIKALAFSGANIFAGNNGGIFLSTDNGTNWITLKIDLFGGGFQCLAVSGTNIYGGVRWGGGIFLSTDNGTNWTPVVNGLTNRDISSLAINGSNIFAGTGDGIFLSTNDGTNWTPINNGINVNWVKSFAVSGTNIYAAANLFEDGGGVYYSSDNGSNWTSVGLKELWVIGLACVGTNIFAATQVGGVYLSTNNGTDWTQVMDGLGYYNVMSIIANETHIFAGSLGVWKRPISELILPVELTSFTANIKNDFIILNWMTATELNNMGFNIERSVNKSDWSKIAFVQGNQNSTRIINYSYTDKSINQSGKYFYRLKQIDNDGSFKYSDIAEADVNSPSAFALNQNYPNPFNPSTTINYSIAKEGNVKLTVYNTIGSKVTTIVNEYKPAGNYSVQFNGSSLASGIYFYRLESGNYSAAKNFIILK
jgi:hypothetical protein